MSANGLTTNEFNRVLLRQADNQGCRVRNRCLLEKNDDSDVYSSKQKVEREWPLNPLAGRA